MTDRSIAMQCPGTSLGGDTITLAHGEGGRLLRRFVRERILPTLNSTAAYEDAAILPQMSAPLAFTTDSFVVSPLFFPGGDIGRLAVFGTANDLAVAGARPRWLSLGLILEEGLPLDALDRVLQSIAEAARSIGVTIVTGDTKVVPSGATDALFINTAGIGELMSPPIPGPARLQSGDELLVSGPIGRHGMAVMAAREQMEIEPVPLSDCAPLFPAVEAMRSARIPVRALRDATRGGVAAVLHEWAAECELTMAIEEQRVPVTPEVRGVCELLGLDPLHVANEGTMVLAVPSGQAEAALAALRGVEVSAQAAAIGHVQAKQYSPVVVQRGFGRLQPLDEPLGAPLPRIC